MLMIFAGLVSRFARLPKNITVLFLAQPFVAASAPILVFIGSIVSTKMATNPSLVTLPLGLSVAGTACATIPAALLARGVGRRNASIIGFSSVFIGSITAGLAIMQSSFVLFCCASFLIGLSMAFVQQLRFAAVESVEEKDINKSLSILMFAGIFSAMIGPEVVMLGENIFSQSIGFAAPFFGLSIMSMVSMFIMLQFKNTQIESVFTNESERPISLIIKQPIFIVSVFVAALSYGLMSYIMTSTPLSMHQVQRHDLSDTKWVIQSHIAAMYLPSLVTTWLSKRIGIHNILVIGSILFAIVVIIAKSGHSVLHYWWALITLGVAWNFLFFSGTSLLHYSYNESEKHKVQAVNDFSVFAFQGASSLLAGRVLSGYGWNGIVYSAIPFICVMFIISSYYYVYRKVIT